MISLFECLLNTQMSTEYTSQGVAIACPDVLGNYVIKKTIAVGEHCILKEAFDMVECKSVALKVYSRDNLNEANLFVELEKANKLSQMLDHPNILKFKSYEYRDSLLIIATDFYHHGTLNAFIRDQIMLTEEMTRRILSQLLSAVSYLHSRGIVHRQISSKTVLLSRELVACLTHFESRKVVAEKKLLTSNIGNFMIAPPEVIENIPYSGEKVDIWQLGVLLFEMSTGKLPWNGENEMTILNQINNEEIAFPPSMNQEMISVFRLMTEKDPTKRPTAEECLRLPWFNALDRPILLAPLRARSGSFRSSENFRAHITKPNVAMRSSRRNSVGPGHLFDSSPSVSKHTGRKRLLTLPMGITE